MKRSADFDKWVRCFDRPASGRLRLLCFHHAGGSATAFRSWPVALRPDVELWSIQLPGREDRLREPPFVRLEPLVQALVEVLAPRLVVPYAFFGHSMGALVGFELARALRRRHQPLPACVCVSSFRAPCLPGSDPPIHALPDAEFIEELGRFDNDSERTLQHEELRQLLLPALRADFAVCESYIHAADVPLDCPILAFGGQADPRVSREDLDGWRELTSRTFQLTLFPGKHFYLNTAQESLLSALNQTL